MIKDLKTSTKNRTNLGHMVLAIGALLVMVVCYFLTMLQINLKILTIFLLLQIINCGF